MGEFIDGNKVAESVKAKVKEKVAVLRENGKEPGLVAILVGKDLPSQRYVRNKEKTARELGMYSRVIALPQETSQEELYDLIGELNENRKVNGILVQLPLPDHLDRYKVTEQINPKKDVDCLHPYNIGKLSLGQALFEPCTPKGILTLLSYYKISTNGKNVVVLGRSDIVGRPLSIMLSDKKRNATVTLAHSGTRDLCDIAKEADILISAIGKPNYVGYDMVRDDAVVIDVGINRWGNKIVGDVNFEEVYKKASYITPVPGGVGPMTVVSLMENTLKAAEIQPT